MHDPNDIIHVSLRFEFAIFWRRDNMLGNSATECNLEINSIVNLFTTVNSEANARRIQMVESCFGSSGEQLLVSGRVLVGEGVLTSKLKMF